jgi:hypothetical protein
MEVMSILYGGRFRESTRRHFLDGFESVFPRAQGGAYELLGRLFRVDEMTEFFTLKADYETTTFVANTYYAPGYDYPCREMCWLRQVYDEMSLPRRKALFAYVTGSSSLEGPGWSSLGKSFLVSPGHATNTASLEDPSSDPSELTLIIPIYPDIDVLRRRLYKVVNRHLQWILKRQDDPPRSG